ncbi:hypothetical protein ACMGDK_08155 [Chryseobacterium sp. DT-3]|uniref:hypothetical protein n=1 Tax=Chryseobacterium sp. DT-3 TaxID=3396164 RepID=UPI003F1D4833
MKNTIISFFILLFFFQSCEVDKNTDKEEFSNGTASDYYKQAEFNLNSILSLSKNSNPLNPNAASKIVPDLPVLETRAISAYLVEERVLECGKSYVYVATATDVSAYDRMVWITIKKNSTTIDTQYVIIPAGQQTNSVQFNRIYANVAKPYPINDAIISVTDIVEFSPGAPNLTSAYVKNSTSQYIENCMTLNGIPDFCEEHGGDHNHNGICDDTDRIIRELQGVDTSVD